MKMKVFACLLAAAILAALLLWGPLLPLRAQGRPDASSNLGKVLENQREILKQLSEIKLELDKIRIRITTR